MINYCFFNLDDDYTIFLLRSINKMNFINRFSNIEQSLNI